MLEALGIGRQPVDRIDTVHRAIEAMKLALTLADLYHYNADSAAMRIAPSALLGPDYLAERAKLIDRSGVVVPGTGISLQNRGYRFALAQGHGNQVGPSKRPSHSIIPAFSMHADGTPQMALHMLRYGQNPQAVADAPRWRVTGGRGEG